MRRPYVALAVLGCLLGACVGVGRAVPPPPAAVLTGVVGQVTVRTADGQALTVRAALPLHVGDQISVGAEGRAKILFPNQPPRALQAGQTFVVKATAREAAGDPGTLARLWKSVVGRLRSSFVGERRAPAAADRDLGDLDTPRLLSPCNTALLEMRPQFSWTKVEGAEKYLVTIAFYATQEKTCQLTAPAPPVTYPQEAAPLQAERRYFWCVEVADDPESLSKGAWFLVLSEDRRNQYLEAAHAVEELYAEDPEEQAEVLGYLAAEYGLFALAAEQLSSALRARPEDETLRRALAGVYDAMDLRDLANKTLGDLPPLTEPEQQAWERALPEGQPGQP